MDKIIYDLNNYVEKIYPLINYLSPKLLKKTDEIYKISMETYVNLYRSNHVLFGPDTYIKEINKKTLDFFKELINNYSMDTLVINEIEKIEIQNKTHFDNFRYLVKIFKVLKKHYHPIYCVINFLSFYPIENEKMMLLSNLSNIILNLVDFEIRRLKCKSIKCFPN